MITRKTTYTVAVEAKDSTPENIEFAIEKARDAGADETAIVTTRNQDYYLSSMILVTWVVKEVSSE